MKTLTTTRAAIASIPLLAAAFLIQACGGGSNAVAQSASDADPIEGTWESAVTIRDCASGAALRSFRGLTLLQRGGAASATNNLPPAGNSPAFGSWKREAAPATYSARLRFYRINPDGSFAGAQNVTRSLMLAADGKTLDGTISIEVLDAADKLLQSGCGTETATRVTTE